MTGTAINFGIWWITWRKKIDEHFILFMTGIAVLAGGILLFSGIHVLKTPLLVHILEFVFTFTLNTIFVFGLTRHTVEDNIHCLVAFPSFFASLSFSFYVVCLRVIPHYSPITPWIVSFENTLIYKTWMPDLWVAISIFGGLFIQVMVYWAVSRSRFIDIAWPFLTYFLVTMILNVVANFFLFLANYSTKVIY